MNKKTLFVLWGVLFVITAVLGFLTAVPQGIKLVMSILFFLPPAALLWKKERDTSALIRNLSALSLGITLLALILNFVLAVSSETMGNILHAVLTVVSAPMICSGYWVLSLFLWACLLMVSLRNLKKKSV